MASNASAPENAPVGEPAGEMIEINYITDEDLFGIYKTCLWSGAAAPNFADNRTAVTIVNIANFWVANPNGTIGDFASYLGTDNATAGAYAELFGGPEGMIGTTYYAGELLQIAPHPQNTTAVLPLFVFFTVMTTMVMGLRMFSRKTIAGRIMTFDWAILVGFVMTLVWGALAVKHSQVEGPLSAFYDKTWNQYRESSTYYFILFALYPLTIFVIKLSLLLFYYEMSTWRALRIAVIITLVLSLGNALASFFAWIFQCDHWNYWDHRFFGTCTVNIKALTVSTSAINIATDILIWGLPMPLVAKLQLYPRERILAIFTFGFGAFACIASGFRLQAIRDHILYSHKSSSVLMIDVWTIIELNLAIICASAPALRALVVAHAPKILSSYGSSGFGGSNGSHSGYGRGRFGSFSVKGGPFAYKPDNSLNKSRRNSNSEGAGRKLTDLSPPTTQRRDSIDIYMSVSEKGKAETRSYPADIAPGRQRAASNSNGSVPRYAAAIYSVPRQNLMS